ncbi:MAG: branched-chain amino acid ABC transporter permease, partial [Bacillota bacterium]
MAGKTRAVSKSTLILPATLVLVVLLDDILGTSFLQPYAKHLVFVSLIYSILALSLNFVTGYVGQVSLGHAAFFGFGGYISAALTVFGHLSFWLALPIAGVLTALVGIPLGLPALRVKGPFLVVVTYGFCEVMRFMAIN